MFKRIKHYYQKSYAKTNDLFKNYSKCFRVLSFWSGAIITLQLVLIFFPESLLTIVFEFLGLAYMIIVFSLFLVESIIHGVSYLKSNQ